MTLTGTARYGELYWCIKTDLAPDGEIYLCADRMEILPSGVLVAWGGPHDADGRAIAGREVINLAVAAGHWSAVFAASLIDGGAVAIEHWKGEVTRECA